MKQICSVRFLVWIRIFNAINYCYNIYIYTFFERVLTHFVEEKYERLKTTRFPSSAKPLEPIRVVVVAPCRQSGFLDHRAKEIPATLALLFSRVRLSGYFSGCGIRLNRN